MESPLLVEGDTQPVKDAYEAAERVIHGAIFANYFINNSDDQVRNEVVSYMAECILAHRPVSPTCAISYLGYWDNFKANLFRLVALEERELEEAINEGVPLYEGHKKVLQEAGEAFRRQLAA